RLRPAERAAAVGLARQGRRRAQDRLPRRRHAEELRRRHLRLAGKGDSAHEGRGRLHRERRQTPRHRHGQDRRRSAGDSGRSDGGEGESDVLRKVPEEASRALGRRIARAQNRTGGGTEVPPPVLSLGRDFYQLTRTPKRMIRGAMMLEMLFALLGSDTAPVPWLYDAMMRRRDCSVFAFVTLKMSTLGTRRVLPIMNARS